jgi:1,2-diacylglycerol 3-alpha-glucosyltransferase
MAQGAPVVSTAELGTRSILKPDCGAVVVAEQQDEFAAAVIRVLQSPALQKELGDRGRVYAKTWSSASMARRLADLYDTIRIAKAARVAA